LLFFVLGTRHASMTSALGEGRFGLRSLKLQIQAN
jgi:hypothetical protein